MSVALPDRVALTRPPEAWPLMRQRWEQLGFLHWRVDTAALRPLVPAALELDTFEGTAYVGIVPFTIPYSRLPFAPVPLLPGFHEINLRTYVAHPRGGPGVWFFSLDAASRLAVQGARAGYALPYHAAEMSLVEEGGAVRYASRRRSDGATFRGRYAPSGTPAAAVPGTLEFFLAERYLLYASRGGRLLEARVHHAAYPLQPATAEVEQETLCAAAGLPAAAGPPLAHYAQAVDVRIYPPRRVG